MDLSKLSLSDFTDKPIWKTVEYNGEPIINNDKAFKIAIQYSDDVKKAVTEFNKIETMIAHHKATNVLLTKLNDKAFAENSKIEAIKEKRLEAAIANLMETAITDWEGCFYDGKDLEFTKDNLLKVFGSQSLLTPIASNLISEVVTDFLSPKTA